MELIYFDKYIQKEVFEDLVVAIGQFDGFHLAHMALLNKVKERAKAIGAKTALMTFDPHPDFVLKKNNDFTYITPLVDKAKSLAKLGFDYMIVIKFDLEVAGTDPEIFVKNYLTDILVKEVVVGFDFCFGYKGSGKANMITELSGGLVTTHIIDEIKYHDVKLGSTLIRGLLKEGKVEEVIDVMGHPYSIEAEVITGRKVGRTVNVPTANLRVSEKYVKIKKGVYGVIVTHNGIKYRGIANYGHNPTFNFKEKATLEIHLLDFNGDLYGETIKVEFMIYLRDEVKFNSKEEFVEQINKDIIKTKEIINL